MRLVQASESVLFSSLQPTYRSMGIFFLHRCEVTIKIVVSIRPSLRLHAHSNLKPPEHFFIIGVQPLGRFGQRPELSQPTGMVLVRCILGKFLEVVCHCFPPRLDVPTFTTRCLHGRHNARDPSSGIVELWARMLSGNFAEMTTSMPFKDLLHAANLRHGTIMIKF